mmetsp:Transcript_71673/g.205690  ORF Transcript_71673/g.205690 Transcript_71673/m.205690 type:complete len:231 (+) Transcript_71673:683-1375(+)
MPPALATNCASSFCWNATSSRLPSKRSVAAEAVSMETPFNRSAKACNVVLIGPCPPLPSRIARDSANCWLSISRHEVGLAAAGSLATSRIQAAPVCQSGKTTLWYSTTSGSGLTRTTAEVTTPRQPSLPRMRPGNWVFAETRPKAVRPPAAEDEEPPPLRCQRAPAGVTTRASTIMSSMLPYLARFIPEARVAIQPPRVENSMESGSMPMVTPCSANSCFKAAPVIPAWM